METVQDPHPRESGRSPREITVIGVTRLLFNQQDSRNQDCQNGSERFETGVETDSLEADIEE